MKRVCKEARMYVSGVRLMVGILVQDCTDKYNQVLLELGYNYWNIDLEKNIERPRDASCLKRPLRPSSYSS